MKQYVIQILNLAITVLFFATIIFSTFIENVTGIDRQVIASISVLAFLVSLGFWVDRRNKGIY